VLLLPLLLILFLGIADFGRVFQSGVIIEAAARDGAEIAAEEYRNHPPPPGDLTQPAPPGDPLYYQPLHDLAARTACREMRVLASTVYTPDNPATPATNEEACGSMPVIRVCIHDQEDPLCEQTAFGASIPAECSGLSAPMTNAMQGGSEPSRYVEVRICYRFQTLIHVQMFSLGDVWLDKDRVFTVGFYPPPPTPTPPPQPSPPSPEELPTDTPSPSPSDTPAPTPTDTPVPAPTDTPSPASTGTPSP
jgi:hypothetical protein